jgi:hypothetical protein
MRLSQRFYPIRYEWSRIARIAVAGVVSWGLSMLLVPGGLRPSWGLLAHGTMVLGCYPVLLFAMGFYQSRELAVLRDVARRLGRRAAPVTVGDSVEAAGEIVSVTTSDETGGAPGGEVDGPPRPLENGVARPRGDAP